MTAFLQAFFDGFTGGNVMSWAEMPGSATQVFADESSDYPQRELMQSLLKQPEANEKQESGVEPSIFDDAFFRGPLERYAGVEGALGRQMLSPETVPNVTLSGDAKRLVQALRSEIGNEKALHLVRKVFPELTQSEHGT